MNRTQIMSRLRRLLGPSATYEHKPNAPDANERAELRTKARETFEQLTAAKERLDAKRRELLADPEYKRLFSEWSALDTKRNELQCKSFRYPITVGRHNGIGIVVEAQGDTWAEVFATIEANR